MGVPEWVGGSVRGSVAGGWVGRWVGGCKHIYSDINRRVLHVSQRERRWESRTKSSP